MDIYIYASTCVYTHRLFLLDSYMFAAKSTTDLNMSCACSEIGLRYRK